MNRQEVIKIMGYIFADHGIALTKEKVDVWHDQLNKIPYELAHDTARRVVGRKSFGPPKIADFLEAMRELEIGDDEAWALAMWTIKRYGRYDKANGIAFLAGESLLLAQTMDCLWNEFCDSTIDTIPALRAHFWRMLASAKTRQTQNAIGLDSPRNQGMAHIATSLPMAMKGIQNHPPAAPQKRIEPE